MEQGTRPRNRKTMTNWFLQHIREEEGKKNQQQCQTERLSGEHSMDLKKQNKTNKPVNKHTRHIGSVTLQPIQQGAGFVANWGATTCHSTGAP